MPRHTNYPGRRSGTSCALFTQSNGQMIRWTWPHEFDAIRSVFGFPPSLVKRHVGILRRDKQYYVPCVTCVQELKDFT